jgi:hypothetical protein
MRRRDARLGGAVLAAGLFVSLAVLSGAPGSAATESEMTPASAQLRLAADVEQVEPDLVVRAYWQWAPSFGEETSVLTVRLAPGAAVEPEGTSPIVGDSVEIAGRREGDTFVADELIVVDLD